MFGILYSQTVCVFASCGRGYQKSNLRIFYFGNTVFAIGHTLGFSHKQNMQDELQFAILANLKVA